MCKVISFIEGRLFTDWEIFLENVVLSLCIEL